MQLPCGPLRVAEPHLDFDLAKKITDFPHDPDPSARPGKAAGPRLCAGSGARHRSRRHRRLAQIGRGNEHAADQAAVEAMRAAFNALPIDGTVVIGEGERDEAPMLFIGEKVGQGGLAVDIALDPLEGTTLTAKAMANALAVMAMAEPGTMLNAPDTYMDKIAIGRGYKDGPDRSGCRTRRQHQRPGQGQGRAAAAISPRCSWTGRAMKR